MKDNEFVKSPINSSMSLSMNPHGYYPKTKFIVIAMLMLVVFSLRLVPQNKAMAATAEELCIASGGQWADHSEFGGGTPSCGNCTSGKTIHNNVCATSEQIQCERGGHGVWGYSGGTADHPQFSCICNDGYQLFEGNCRTPQQICEAGNGVWLDNTCSAAAQDNSGSCDDFSKSIFGIPTWYKYLDGEIVSGKCMPVLTAQAGAESIEGARLKLLLPIGLAVLEAMMTLGGIVAVVMVFVGSFKFVLSQGESDKAAGARKTVVNAMIGLVIIIVATRVVSFIGGRLG